MTQKRNQKWWEDATLYPLRQTVSIDPALLDFDLQNPRYTPDKELPHTNDREIIQFYDQTSDLNELIQSISQSGYVGIEPMIVMGKGDELIVLEGNRRLAAIMLLSKPSLASECGISLPETTDKKLATLKSVSIYRVENREEARDYIGFKHINGPHKWDSYAKAKYAIQWYEQEQKKTNGLKLSDIASRMGDGHSTILRMVNGYYVLQQAMNNNVFHIEDREKKRQFAFSHLYTALTRPGIKKHLGLEDVQNNEVLGPSPIANSKINALREVMEWIYGSDSKEIRAAVRTQNPDIKKLSEVLEHPKAKAILTASGDLAKAHSEVDPPSAQFERHLVAAIAAIEKSLGKVSAYTGDHALLEIVEDASNSMESLVTNMRAKAKSESE